LVIDEGFGTQDEKGRQLLIEALNKIKNSFSKILVVTHLESLKSAFDQQIEVYKDSQGSRILVS
jgi:exonuclease SbcC